MLCAIICGLCIAHKCRSWAARILPNLMKELTNGLVQASQSEIPIYSSLWLYFELKILVRQASDLPDCLLRLCNIPRVMYGVMHGNLSKMHTYFRHATSLPQFLAYSSIKSWNMHDSIMHIIHYRTWLYPCTKCAETCLRLPCFRCSI